MRASKQMFGIRKEVQDYINSKFSSLLLENKKLRIDLDNQVKRFNAHVAAQDLINIDVEARLTDGNENI